MPAKHRYQLVLQFPCQSIQDYDALIALEEAFMDAVRGAAIVDGHDSGSGEFNIFVHTDTPEESVARLKPVLVSAGYLAGVRVAVREFGVDGFRMVWPKGDPGPFVVA